MKVAALAFALPLAAAFSQESRREAVKSAAASVAALGAATAFVPRSANAAAGESPRFSVFGLLGDGSSMSEGAAYGTDQSTPLYSPYSVYGNVGGSALYKEGDSEYITRAKATLTETKKRLAKLDRYVAKKQWWEVRAELSRYMYETRGATKSLAKTPEQKKAATNFFKAMEAADQAAKRKDGANCAAASKDSQALLDAFIATL